FGKLMHVFFVIDGKPHKTPVVVHLYIAYTGAVKELLGDFVIKALPFNEDRNFSVFVCLKFNLRIFHRNVVKIVVIILFLHINREFLLLKHNITQKETACKRQAESSKLLYFFSFFIQRVYRKNRRRMKMIRLPNCGSWNGSWITESTSSTASTASTIPMIPSPAIRPEVKRTPLSERSFFSSSVPLIFSTMKRTTPPAMIPALKLNGRYIPTANGM